MFKCADFYTRTLMATVATGNLSLLLRQYELTYTDNIEGKVPPNTSRSPRAEEGSKLLTILSK